MEEADMQKVFEKIIEQLKEESIIVDDDAGNRAVEIIEQAAAEYNNGWIPVSERLPEESLNSLIGWDAYRERCVFVQYIGGRFVIGDDTESVKITHWMDVPYQANFVQKIVNPISQEELAELHRKIRTIEPYQPREREV